MPRIINAAPDRYRTRVMFTAALKSIRHCRQSRSTAERSIAAGVLVALALFQIATATGHPPHLGPSVNGVRRAASQLSRKLAKGEGRLWVQVGHFATASWDTRFRTA